MLLGLDFDNTLIRYDELFYRMAREKGLIPVTLAKEKNAVRDHLRRTGREDEWTRMQGEAYGPRIREAVACDGALAALSVLRQKGVRMRLISHKTRTPYLGPPHDLHQAAWGWLERHGFFAQNGLGWSEDQVFFEQTKEEKIRRIVALGCTHYVDDLPEILDMLPDTLVKVYYAPRGGEQASGRQVLRTWADLPALLC
ncbi:hypothetical protein SAMN06295888_13219 [Desulfonatronum zhilinae]|nr:hypothetical protein SAMN06295888_13219 [Desulfonatronum zhilinae]